MSLATKNNPYLLKYLPQFDGLRFCAVLLVMCYHYFSFLTTVEDDYNLGAFIAFFFVLSSYLITKILIQAKQKSVETGYKQHQAALYFLFRRAIRIFPAYYFYLIVIVLLPYAGIYLREHAASFFLYAGNFQIYKDQRWGELTTHLWTLAIEEQFYIVWPWIILFIPDKFLKRSIWFIIAAGIIFRLLYFSITKFPIDKAMTCTILTPSCLDAFGFGALLALEHVEGKLHHSILKKLFFAGLPVWVILSNIDYPIITIVYNLVFVEIFSMLIIETAFNGFTGFAGKFLENKRVRYLGKISYGIYLYHLFVPFIFWKIFGRIYMFALYKEGINLMGLANFLALPWVSIWLYIGLTVLMAAFSWNFIEQPMNRLKNLIKIPVKKGDEKVVLPGNLN